VTDPVPADLASPGKRLATSKNMPHIALQPVDLATDLRLALARKELDVHFQPQIAIDSRRIVGVEAFARWFHKDAGWIAPGRFIPLAEESNLIQPLGELVIARSCRQLREWDRAGLPPLRVAVKVAAKQFRSAGFVRSIETALRLAALEPRRLELELAQATLLHDPDQAIIVLEKLKAIGVLVAVDDLGAEYADLRYVWRSPIDCLKLDRSLVHRAVQEKPDAAFSQAIVALAHALELRVVAEGVETPEQLELVSAHDCDEAQGEIFCRPLPVSALAPVLADGETWARKRAS
jgi:EAL domain-containing protein (putative c-di-GMP-specific phosphodiesterase class I)